MKRWIAARDLASRVPSRSSLWRRPGATARRSPRDKVKLGDEARAAGDQAWIEGNDARCSFAILMCDRARRMEISRAVYARWRTLSGEGGHSRRDEKANLRSGAGSVALGFWRPRPPSLSFTQPCEFDGVAGRLSRSPDVHGPLRSITLPAARCTHRSRQVTRGCCCSLCFTTKMPVRETTEDSLLEYDGLADFASSRFAGDMPSPPPSGGSSRWRSSFCQKDHSPCRTASDLRTPSEGSSWPPVGGCVKLTGGCPRASTWRRLTSLPSDFHVADRERRSRSGSTTSFKAASISPQSTCADRGTTAGQDFGGWTALTGEYRVGVGYDLGLAGGHDYECGEVEHGQSAGERFMPEAFGHSPPTAKADHVVQAKEYDQTVQKSSSVRRRNRCAIRWVQAVGLLVIAGGSLGAVFVRHSGCYT